MKTRALLTTAACCALMLPTLSANAQNDGTIFVEEIDIISEVPCKTIYTVDKHDNWFLQLGAGTAMPFLEGRNKDGKRESHMTLNYGLAVGKWFSPHIGWRLAFQGGPLHYENLGMRKFDYVTGNLDFMWDMFNSLHGVNSQRVFSLIPFVGLGGTYAWNFRPDGDIAGHGGGIKTNSWTLPVSLGMQMRFRLCSYADFFLESRTQFYGDNFNNIAYGYPIDVNMTANAGFTITFGGRGFNAYNPCEYLGYINNLNDEVNSLRASLATTKADLAKANAQLPCPETVVEEVTTVIEAAPLMATVRFAFNSAKVSETEMINVYNIAQWLNDNPGQAITITGYADKDTGTAEYNLDLSKRRAQAVYDILVNKYNINPERLSISAEGSSSQPYDINNWNRVVIFNNVE